MVRGATGIAGASCPYYSCSTTVTTHPRLRPLLEQLPTASANCLSILIPIVTPQLPTTFNHHYHYSSKPLYNTSIVANYRELYRDVYIYMYIYRICRGYDICTNSFFERKLIYLR